MSKKKNRKQLQREMIEQKKQEVVASSVDIPTAEEQPNKNKAFFSALSQAQEIHENTPEVNNSTNSIANPMSVAEYKKQKAQESTMLSEAQLEALDKDPRYKEQQYNNTTISNRGFLDSLHQANTETEQPIATVSSVQEEIPESVVEEESIEEDITEEKPTHTVSAIDVEDLLLFLEKEGHIYIKDIDNLARSVSKYFNKENTSEEEDILDKVDIIVEGLMKEYHTADPLEIGAEYEFNFETTLDATYDSIQKYCKELKVPEYLEDDVFEKVIDKLIGIEEDVFSLDRYEEE